MIQSPGDLKTADELREVINPKSIAILNGYVEESFLEYINSDSDKHFDNHAVLLPILLPVQFERHGYYCLDRTESDPNFRSSLPENLTVNLTIPLKVTKTIF